MGTISCYTALLRVQSAGKFPESTRINSTVLQTSTTIDAKSKAKATQPHDLKISKFSAGDLEALPALLLVDLVLILIFPDFSAAGDGDWS